MSETEFKKESKGGMLNLRNFDLSEYIKDYKQEYSTEEVAKKLRELTWEWLIYRHLLLLQSIFKKIVNLIPST